MRILAIETSCDDTGVAVIAADHCAYRHETASLEDDRLKTRTVQILANELSTQMQHATYGGVFPTVAKREHARMLVPLLEQALRGLERYKIKDVGYRAVDKENDGPHAASAIGGQPLTSEQRVHLEALLAREPELLTQLIPFFETHVRPDIDAIAVTYGPGLEPCLWVGVGFAKALSYVWGIPLVGVNHMEGHIAAALATKQEDRSETASLIEDRHVAANLPSTFYLLSSATPQLSLLISGGHTELVLSEKEGSYRAIGQTRDDAVGECFDKCGRMLGLAYPGGPKIGKLAAEAREMRIPHSISLPRPMLHSNDLDFSFSGLKTAVKVALEKDRSKENAKIVDETTQRVFAREIEDAITDVLVAKTRKALIETGAQTLIVSGGVSASTFIRARLTDCMTHEFPTTTLLFSSRELATDNALMIALASIAKIEREEFTNPDALVAQGNLRLG